jgi:hypothetical protein
MASAAPGRAAAPPSATTDAYAASNLPLASWALASSARRSRNTTIFDMPIVARTWSMAASTSTSNPAIAVRKACSTAPSSATVVPARSRQASSMPTGSCTTPA